MLNTEFKDRYKSLNAEQKKAVDTIDGPVMVVAGPGTGKTEVLTLRIANILQKTDIAPENILALTFTEAGASNMRKRLSSMIGSSAYRVAIKTFHSFCNDVIITFPEYFPKIIGSANITDAESVAIVKELVEKLPLDLLRPWGDPYLYVSGGGSIIQKISELKREGINPEEFQKIIEEDEARFLSISDLHYEKGTHSGKMKGEYQKYEKKLVKNKELALVYQKYQEVLHERRLYDWSDMIMETLDALKSHDDLKLILQETYQYILIDEHQDTNNAQNKIVELLADFHQNPNVFIVGDEKQAIFRFQGASVQNFLYFKKLYPKAELITLTKNYRSGQSILDGVFSLFPDKVALSAHHKIDSSIELASFDKSSLELQFVSTEVKKLIESGVTPKEIAVIYRANKEAFPLVFALAKMGIDYSIESDEYLFGEPNVRKFITLLNTIKNYGNDSYLVPILHIEEFNIDPLDVYRLIEMCSKQKISLYDCIEKSKKEEIKTVALKLKKWAKESVNESLSQFLEKILRESGILERMIECKDAEAFLGIERLFEEGKRISANQRGATLKEFMEYIAIVEEHNLFIKRPKYEKTSAVRLMTAHKSKGLEFEYVFIINASERSFGSKADRDKLALVPFVYKIGKSETGIDENSESDERRLFYVAMTRAKKSVCITFSNFDESGKEILPSPFISEIHPGILKTIDTTSFKSEIDKNPEILFSEPKISDIRKIDKDFVSELFYSRPLSVTALNNYLNCPWKYFYRNLLRIPSAPTKEQAYGTAMHAAVEDFWKSIKERGSDKNFLLNSFERELGEQGLLAEAEFNRALEKGKKSLSGWFDWAKPDITNPILTEFSIPGAELMTEHGHVLIGGKLDKVEITSDKKMLVTDFKTGYANQRSKNFLSGNTKEANGDVLRQLQFYKLLLNLHDGISMEKGIIEFLEPNNNGNYSREEFKITEEETNELKKTIERVAHEITTLEFWNKSCDEKLCEYCSYRKLLK